MCVYIYYIILILCSIYYIWNTVVYIRYVLCFVCVWLYCVLCIIYHVVFSMYYVWCTILYTFIYILISYYIISCCSESYYIILHYFIWCHEASLCVQPQRPQIPNMGEFLWTTGGLQHSKFMNVHGLLQSPNYIYYYIMYIYIYIDWVVLTSEVLIVFIQQPS